MSSPDPHAETHSPKPRRRARRSWYLTAIRNTIAAIGPTVIALGMVILRWTCRVRLHNDPRPALRAAGVPYVYSVLHAQQLAAATCGDRGTAAMVSQSQDGALVALGLKLVGIIPIRGSSQRKGRDHGGLAALNNLIEHVRAGGPAYLAVDGPRGPRNRVHKGVAVLSRQANAVILNVVVVPNRRWIIKQSWDRIQIPFPFCRINAYFAEPLHPQPGESAETYRRRIEASLNAWEVVHDPTEAALAAAAQTSRNEGPARAAA
jgi:lysophospholipid acyltransferase (LPLAT)-like uncharacterized protein